MRLAARSLTRVWMLSLVPAAALVLALGLPTERSADESAECLRVRQHLEGAEAILLGADVSHLTAVQRKARAMNIQRLRAYRERGEFPRNLQYSHRHPMFVDDRGVRCAMAHLITESGHGAFVDRVRATANGAYIRELADDPELVAWLARAGLTLAEAARIQPTYSPIRDDTETMSSSEAIAAAAATTLGVSTITWNLTASDTPGFRPRGFAGMLAGAVCVGVGMSLLDESGSSLALGVWNLGTGALAFGLGLANVYDKEEAVEPMAANSSIRVAPLLGGTTGLRVDYSF